MESSEEITCQKEETDQREENGFLSQKRCFFSVKNGEKEQKKLKKKEVKSQFWIEMGIISSKNPENERDQYFQNGEVIQEHGSSVFPKV